MEAKNFILLNMMKRQLLDIYRIFEEENPELLDDPAVNEAYEALKNVTEDGEMRHWRNLMRVLGLSYSTADGIERKDNILGELDDLASRADWNVMYDFLEFKNAFDSYCWDEIEEKNYRLINAIQQMAERSYDVHIIIIRCGFQWVAVGNDADRLLPVEHCRLHSAKKASFLYSRLHDNSRSSAGRHPLSTTGRRMSHTCLSATMG